MTPTPSHPINPWFSMWLRPRETIQSIIDRNPEHLVLLLAALSGFSQALDRASIKNAGDSLAVPVVVLIALAGGAASGVVGLYVLGFLLKITGKWLGGAGNAINIRAAIAWSSVPTIWALLLWLPELALFGNDLFSKTTPNIEANPLLFLGFLAVELVIAVWSLVVFLKCLGQAEGFSAWKALSAMLIAILLVIIPIGLIILVIMAFN